MVVVANPFGLDYTRFYQVEVVPSNSFFQFIEAPFTLEGRWIAVRPGVA
jgi:hypothetical protein